MAQEHRSDQLPRTDWFLIGLVAGVLALIGLTLLLTIGEPAGLTYLEESRPEGVAFNYFVALQKGEYDRAYAYIWPAVPDYPASAGEFFSKIQATGWCREELDDEIGLEVVGVDYFDDRAVVTLQATIFTGRRDLFTTGRYARQITVQLIQPEPAVSRWLLVDSDRCWHKDWRP